MRRLARLALVLVTVCALMMGAALLIGQQHPTPERVERLHLTDCSPPCWNGITPRVSSRGEIETRVNSTFPDFRQLGSGNLPFLTWVFDDLAADDTSINVALDDGLVYSLSIGTGFPSEQMPNLGEMLTVFGAPTCIATDNRSGYSTLSYENAAHQIVLQFSVDQASLFAPVSSLSVGVSKTVTCQKLLALSWPDFRNLQHSFSRNF
jgi:hypothetical protein